MSSSGSQWPQNPPKAVRRPGREVKKTATHFLGEGGECSVHCCPQWHGRHPQFRHWVSRTWFLGRGGNQERWLEDQVQLWEGSAWAPWSLSLEGDSWMCVWSDRFPISRAAEIAAPLPCLTKSVVEYYFKLGKAVLHLFMLWNIILTM